MRLLVAASLCLSLVSSISSVAAAVSPKAAFVKRTQHANAISEVTRRLEPAEDHQQQQHPETFRRRHVSLLDQHRKQVEDNDDKDKTETCDKSLLTCLPDETCAGCFRFLYSENVDWGTVTPDTSCADVVDYLYKKNYCTDLKGNQAATNLFCQSFDACAVWEDDDYDDDDDNTDNNDDEDDDDFIDCSKLTECDWPGMHTSFLGDGICHDFDCYNTAVCNYDGGDCCEDTCTPTAYVDCGHEGYFCRNPTSEKCDPQFSNRCEHGKPAEPDQNNPNPSDTKCEEGQTKYRLVMYDSFGDGWDQTTMTITPTSKRNDMRFNGRLETGSMGTRYVCMDKDSSCMHVNVEGGEWGNEVSWEIKPMSEGAPALAAGGTPMSCDFSVGGTACENTCTGRANKEPNTDPDYKEFKDMYNCIENKCTIQVGRCESDPACSACMAEEKEDYCYGSDAFVAVVDCTMCSCTDRAGSDFCASKLSPGKTYPNNNNNDPDNNGRMPDGSPRPCSGEETMRGSDAVLTFGECTNFDQVSMLVTDYDQNHFGALDRFEACSHSFAKEDNHGGHTALGCMQILVNAKNADLVDDDETRDDNAESIAALANLLYTDAANFCQCASTASGSTPICSSFVHLKVLLYESLDACNSLDEIDCDAWLEFQAPCKRNLESSFGSIDFSRDEQCTFVHDGCGGAGPFPAFRKLDCGAEIPAPAWDFYQNYARTCLKEDFQPSAPSGGKVPTPTTPAPVAPTNPPNPSPVTPATPRPTPKPYLPPSSGGSKPTKPYVPEDDDNTVPYKPSGSSKKKKTHRFRNFVIFCLICGAGFYYYKRRADAFSFVRYRNSRNYAGGESEMYSAPYSGLTMDSGSNSFQPPSLPPTPSAIDGYGYS